MKIDSSCFPLALQNCFHYPTKSNETSTFFICECAFFLFAHLRPKYHWQLLSNQCWFLDRHLLQHLNVSVRHPMVLFTRQLTKCSMYGIFTYIFSPQNLSSAVGTTRLFVLFAVFWGKKSEVRIGQNLGQARFRENSVFRIVLFSKTAVGPTDPNPRQMGEQNSSQPLGFVKQGRGKLWYKAKIYEVELWTDGSVFDGWKESFKDVHEKIFQLWSCEGHLAPNVVVF